MVKISVVINTLNEEKNLQKALTSIRNLNAEVIVVDQHSKDDTVVIAKEFGAKVFQHPKTGYVEPARNYAICKATGDWILIIDADEELTKELANLLTEIAVDPNSSDYYRIPRKNIIFGKWIEHSKWWPDYNIRFFRNGFVTWNEVIHSVPMTVGKGSDVPAEEKYAIIHNNYSSIEQFIDRLNRYTSFQSNEIISGGYKHTWKDMINKPLSEFIGRYFQGEGYKDGIHGLALSLLQAFSELVVYLKVWQKDNFRQKYISTEKFSENIKSSQKEINYWISDTLYKETGKYIHKFKKKFRLL